LNCKEVIYFCRICNKKNNDFSCECTKIKPEVWNKTLRYEKSRKCKKEKIKNGQTK